MKYNTLPIVSLNSPKAYLPLLNVHSIFSSFKSVTNWEILKVKQIGKLWKWNKLANPRSVKLSKWRPVNKADSAANIGLTRNDRKPSPKNECNLIFNIAEFFGLFIAKYWPYYQRCKKQQALQARLCYFFPQAVLIFVLCTRQICLTWASNAGYRLHNK